MELVKQVGFKTTGAPSWLWYTPKSAPLNKLRAAKPKSGLVITEVALEKYKFLNEQAERKAELKKLFEKAKVTAQREQIGSKAKTYEQDGFTSFVVEPSTEKFEHTYTAPAPPSAWCFICGDSVHAYEGTDLCLWCSEKF